MEITATIEGKKNLVVGEGTLTPIVIPVERVNDVVESVKRLDFNQHQAILEDAGIEVVPGMANTSAHSGCTWPGYIAQSIVQNKWYEASYDERLIDDNAARHKWKKEAQERGLAEPEAETQSHTIVKATEVVPKGVLDGHNERVKKYLGVLAEVKAQPAPAPPKPKEVKVIKNDGDGDTVVVEIETEPKAPRAKVPRASSNGTYSINPEGDAVAAGNLTGKTKWFYLAIKEAGSITKADLLAKAIAAAGTEFKTELAATSQTNYQPGVLVKAGLVLLA